MIKGFDLYRYGAKSLGLMNRGVVSHTLSCDRFVCAMPVIIKSKLHKLADSPPIKLSGAERWVTVLKEICFRLSKLQFI